MHLQPAQFSTDRITAYSAMVVGLSALLVSVWQGVETRNHYRLSLAPRLTFEVRNFPFPTGEPGGIFLSNEGIGPAIITDFDILVGDSSFSSWSEALKFLGIDETWVRYASLDIGDTIGAGDSVALVNVIASPAHPLGEPEHQRFATALSKLRIGVKAESLYGDVYERDSLPKRAPR